MKRKTVIFCFVPGVPNSPVAADWPTFVLEAPGCMSNRRARVLFKRMYLARFGVRPGCCLGLYHTNLAGVPA